MNSSLLFRNSEKEGFFLGSIFARKGIFITQVEYCTQTQKPLKIDKTHHTMLNKVNILVSYVFLP